MDTDIYGLVQRILWGVGFIAIFAQSIFGSKTIHQQLEKLLRQNEQIIEQLKQIARHLEEGKDDPKKES